MVLREHEGLLYNNIIFIITIFLVYINKIVIIYLTIKIQIMIMLLS
jgi:hypothetical protein